MKNNVKMIQKNDVKLFEIEVEHLLKQGWEIPNQPFFINDGYGYVYNLMMINPLFEKNEINEINEKNRKF